jgi:hypothetical protein
MSTTLLVPTPALSPLPLPATLQRPFAAVLQLTEAEKAAEELSRDWQTVKNELYRWKEDLLVSDSAPLNLVRFWYVGYTN